MLKLAAIRNEAQRDVLAYMTFPKEHRAKLHSINPIERINAEIKRRRLGNLGRHLSLVAKNRTPTRHRYSTNRTQNAPSGRQGYRSFRRTVT